MSVTVTKKNNLTEISSESLLLVSVLPQYKGRNVFKQSEPFSLNAGVQSGPVYMNKSYILQLKVKYCN